MLAKYSVKHKITTIYHSQTIGQLQLSNEEVKIILKKVVNPSKYNRFLLLKDVLWVYKIPLGLSPYRLVFRKSFHLPIEFQYRTHLAIKKLNLDLQQASEVRLMQLHE